MFKHNSTYYPCWNCTLFPYCFSENRSVYSSSSQVFAEMLVESFIAAILKHVCITGCQQITLLRFIFYSQLCAGVFEELESNLSSLNNYFYLEWLFPHQIQVYRWAWEPEVLCLVQCVLLSVSYRSGSCADLRFPTQMGAASAPVRCDLWGPGQGSPANCSTSNFPLAWC